MEKSLIYGPVPSRRLGLSLGVDLVPYKICPFDCIYCQIGRTPTTTVERREYISPEAILRQLKERLSTGITADYITLGGSGEPTMNSEIGRIIKGIKEICNIPVAVLTNGSMLNLPEVRTGLLVADVVLPSLDAPDAAVFEVINRPHPSVPFRTVIDGLAAFRKIYHGKIWLEIFFIDGVNTSELHIIGFRKWIEAVSPDRVHLNTAVRPPAETFAAPVTEAKLIEFSKILGERAEVIAEFPKDFHRKISAKLIGEELLDMLSRRPCTMEDIAVGLNIEESLFSTHLNALVRRGRVQARESGGKTYYLRVMDETAMAQPG